MMPSLWSIYFKVLDPVCGVSIKVYKAPSKNVIPAQAGIHKFLT
jgi:hypothetical protein